MNDHVQEEDLPQPPKIRVVVTKAVTTLAFLQNMWFKVPARAKRIMERYIANGDGRHLFIRDMLFLSCLTGERLRQALTWDVCAEIIWEEAHPDFGEESSSKFGFDARHMAEAIRIHKPDVILAFGKIAQEGVAAAKLRLGKLAEVPVICGPHPAARGGDTIKRLAEVAIALAERKAVTP